MVHKTATKHINSLRYVQGMLFCYVFSEQNVSYYL